MAKSKSDEVHKVLVPAWIPDCSDDELAVEGDSLKSDKPPTVTVQAAEADSSKSDKLPTATVQAVVPDTPPDTPKPAKLPIVTVQAFEYYDTPRDTPKPDKLPIVTVQAVEADDPSPDNDQQMAVLDMNGEFYIKGNRIPKITFRLPDIGSINCVVRPVPNAAAVVRAKAAMRSHNIVNSLRIRGSGWRETGNPLYRGVTFKPPDNITGTDYVCVYRPIGLTSYDPPTVERICLRPQRAPALGSVKTMFIYVAGACRGEGNIYPQAHGGYAFIFNSTPDGTQRGVVKRQGLDGSSRLRPTRMQAEVRAVLAALWYRDWYAEGWEKVVIVTDSVYIAKGATAQIQEKQEVINKGGPRTCMPNSNREMWQALSSLLGTYAAAGCVVAFWHVEPEWNQAANRAASEAACRGQPKSAWSRLTGDGV